MKLLKWFGREIECHEVYFVYFPDKKREMTAAQRENYDQARNFPVYGPLFAAGVSPQDNPNVLPMTGMEMMEVASKNGYIPVFDQDFQKSHRVTLMKGNAMDFYYRYSKILKR